MGAYIAIWHSRHVLTVTAHAILALTIAIELYRGARTNLVTPATTTTTSFLNNIETVKTIRLTETITAIEPKTVMSSNGEMTKTAVDHLTPSSTCVCVLTGTWNTPTVAQTKDSFTGKECKTT
jgi:hypothetical protein